LQLDGRGLAVERVKFEAASKRYVTSERLNVQEALIATSRRAVRLRAAEATE
jgi:hypothetical protein